MLAPSPARHKLSAMSPGALAAALLVGLAALAGCRAPPPGDGSLGWTAPAPRAGVVLVHGFARNPSHHADHLAALASVRVAVVVPAMPSWLHGEAARDAAVTATLAALGHVRPSLGPDVPVTLVGFSAGGAIVTEAAARLAAAGHAPDGLVLLDPVPWPRSLAAAASLPPQLPALVLLAPPGGCNAGGRGTTLAAALPGPTLVETVPSASHCDFEAPTDTLCRLACGPDDHGRRAAIITELVRFVLDPRAAAAGH